MGFFSDIVDKVKNNPIKAIGAGFGGLAAMPLGLPGMAAGALGGSKVGGVVEGGSLEDLLYGKKTKSKADPVADLVKAGQVKGIRELNSALDSTNSEQIVNQQADAAKKGVLASAEDARRNAQTIMARRGLQNSSLGLAQNRTIDQNTGNQIAEVNAKLPGALRDQKLSDAQMRISQGGLGPSNPIQWNPVTGRGGGLLDLAGKIAPIAGMFMGMPSFGGGGSTPVGATGLRPDIAGGTTGYSRSYLGF